MLFIEVVPEPSKVIFIKYLIAECTHSHAKRWMPPLLYLIGEVTKG